MNRLHLHLLLKDGSSELNTIATQYDTTGIHAFVSMRHNSRAIFCRTSEGMPASNPWAPRASGQTLHLTDTFSDDVVHCSHREWPQERLQTTINNVQFDERMNHIHTYHQTIMPAALTPHHIPDLAKDVHDFVLLPHALVISPKQYRTSSTNSPVPFADSAKAR